MTWKCYTCTNLNPSYALHCSNCGNRKAANNQHEWICGSCGSGNTVSSSFCIRCGEISPASGPTGPINTVVQPVLPMQAFAGVPDFTTKAVITAILYALLWLPGVVANILWWLEAHRVKKQSGIEPTGYGCLLWMFIIFVAIPSAIAGILLLLVLIAGISLTGWFASQGLK
jgi:hypothetical protein